MRNAIKAKLKAGDAVFGFRMDFNSPYIVEILGSSVCLDILLAFSTSAGFLHSRSSNSVKKG